jgi:hypothetical protein
MSGEVSWNPKDESNRAQQEGSRGVGDQLRDARSPGTLAGLAQPRLNSRERGERAPYLATSRLTRRIEWKGQVLAQGRCREILRARSSIASGGGHRSQVCTGSTQTDRTFYPSTTPASQERLACVSLLSLAGVSGLSDIRLSSRRRALAGHPSVGAIIKLSPIFMGSPAAVLAA